MNHFFDTLERILTSDRHHLEDLAVIAGLPVQELFMGEQFDGIDLTDEPIEVLERIEADFSRAGLTIEQKRRLGPQKTSRDARSKARRMHAVKSMRRHRMEQFIEKNFRPKFRDAARAVLVLPLDKQRRVKEGWTTEERNFASNAIKLVAYQADWLHTRPELVLMELLVQIRAMRVPVDEKALAYIREGTKLVLNVATMRVAFDLDFCTDDFVFGWLSLYDQARFEEDRKPGNWVLSRPQVAQLITEVAKPSDADAFRKEYQSALLVAIAGRSHASAGYLSRIVELTRSHEECIEVLGAIESRSIDRDVAARLARVLSRRTISGEQIERTLLEPSIDRKIVAAYRRLVAVSSDKIGREALLRVISLATEHASAIELDTILSDVGVDAGLQLMKPFLGRLALHHRRIALASLSEQASTSAQRKRVSELRDRYLVERG